LGAGPCRAAHLSKVIFTLIQGRNGSDRVLFDLLSSHRRTAGATDALLAAAAVEGLSLLTAAASLSA
jgi:hypothetical protein